MKINPEMANLVNVVRKESGQNRKPSATGDEKKIADIITVENQRAAATEVDTMEQAKSLIAEVNRDLGDNPDDVYALNSRRVMSLLS